MTNFHGEASIWEDSVSLDLACCGDCLFRVQKSIQQDIPAQKTYVNVQVHSNPNKKGGHPYWLTCRHSLQLSQEAQERDPQALKLLPSFLDAPISYCPSLPAVPWVRSTGHRPWPPYRHESFLREWAPCLVLLANPWAQNLPYLQHPTTIWVQTISFHGNFLKTWE